MIQFLSDELISGMVLCISCDFLKKKNRLGKVNNELIKEFSRLFHKEVKIVSRFAFRQKRLSIRC